ncbi:MAG: hypothetical protein HY922_03270 [Elusimicrobia bacterium]|nr:hypothetical protein [Elusimicrobiota bacterium]
MIDLWRKWRYSLSMRAYLLRQQGLKLLGNLGELFLRLCICVFLGAAGVYFLEYFGVVRYKKVAPKILSVWDSLRGTGNPVAPGGASGRMLAKGEPQPEEAKPKKRARKKAPEPVLSEDEDEASDEESRPARKKREFVRAKTFLAAEDFSSGSRSYGMNKDAAGGILRKFDSIPFGHGAVDEDVSRQGKAKAARRRPQKADEAGSETGRGVPQSPGVKEKQSPVMGAGAQDMVLRPGELEDEGNLARWRKAEAERLANEEFWRRFGERMALGGLISLIALVASFFLSGLFSLARESLMGGASSEGNFKDFNFRPTRKSDSGRSK